jgi:transcriptional regulator with XRE-family HTH domain
VARKYRTHVSDDKAAAEASASVAFAPKHITKQDFAKRLYQLMVGKGWHQSELARQSGLARDNVSRYTTGKSMPSPLALRALARALDVKPEDIMPNYIESAIDEDAPALDIKVSTNSPTKAWLRVNQLVSTDTAVKVAQILQADAANRS